MHRSKRKRNIIIFSLVGVLLCMVAGYAAFQTQLKVTGTSKVTSNWDIEITNVTAGTPTGSAENAVAPSFDKLWASMEANLYDKGDAMEYDVTIENKGTIDAKLNDILTNLSNSNSDAVIITFSEYTKGEVLKAKSNKIVHVKIAYNPEYAGGETSSEVEINFDYTQDNKSEDAPVTYLLTYDYKTNGGDRTDSEGEYLVSGSDVNLDVKAYKQGWTFVGWNTNKNAETRLSSYQMPERASTLYAIYKKDIKVTYEKGSNIKSIGENSKTYTIYNNETSYEITLPSIEASEGYIVDGWYNGNEKVGSPNDTYTVSDNTTLIAKAKEDNVTLSISTSSTTNSITVVANAYADSGIAKYEYSKDGGKTWEESTSNTYTFTGLTVNTNYDITVRITTQTGKTMSATKTTITSSIVTPTFKETGEGEVTITYPSGCGTTYTCTYQKEGESAINVTNTTAEVLFGTDGTVVAQVTDGNNTVSSTYSLVRKNMYVSSIGNDTSGYGTREKPYLTLQKAYDSATSVTKANIYVMSDLDISTSTKFNDSNKNINLSSDNSNDKIYTLKKATAYRDTIVSVDAGKASFSNIIFDGNKIEDIYAGFYTGEGTEVQLNNGVILQNFINTSQTGTASIISSGATITINGAKVINNKALYDVGVKVVNGGKLNFNDGEISNNEATQGAAAGILLYGSDMTMTGGKILNNKSKDNSGGLYVGYYENGNGSNARILGGEISNNTSENTGGGIFVNSTETQISKLEIGGNAKISGNKGTYGGGIRSINSTVEITSGTITKNTAEGGAGISINGGTLNISGGTISNNTAINEDGGGIRGYMGVVINITDGTIIGNKARYGGAVLVGNVNSKLTISGGTISNNESTQGNVSVINKSIFNLSGGTINNNKSTQSDGGILLSNSTFTTPGIYNYYSGIVCGNKPTNSYETSTSCPTT